VKVEGTYTFRGPRTVVWELLQDPDVLAQAMPGAQRLVRTAEDRYEGVMKVGIGPVTAAEFSLAVTLGDKVPPERFTMSIDSKGSLGFTRGTAHVELTDAPDGGTMMRYRSDLQIGGRIAAVGQRMVDTAARMMTQKGLEALQRALETRLAGSPGGPSSGPS
jgi:carbon monoxide dehydrogenase subunit G